MPEHFTPDHDPLDDLRAAWNSLDAPEPADELGEADPATRQSVEWMRAAWATVEPTRRLARPAPAPTLRPMFRPDVLLRLAAAVLVIALAALLWWRPSGVPADPSPVAHEDLIDQHASEPERVEERPVLEHGVQFASLTSEKIEMRSGPVRLVLVTGGGPTADGSAPDDSSEEER